MLIIPCLSFQSSERKPRSTDNRAMRCNELHEAILAVGRSNEEVANTASRHMLRHNPSRRRHTKQRTHEASHAHQPAALVGSHEGAMSSLILIQMSEPQHNIYKRSVGKTDSRLDYSQPVTGIAAGELGVTSALKDDDRKRAIS